MKKYSNFSILIIISAFVYIFLGCNKCGFKGKVYHEPINQIFIDYLGGFKDNSYWVYQDSASQIIDTFVLHSYSREYVNLYTEGCEFNEKLSYYFQSKKSLKNVLSLECLQENEKSKSTIELYFFNTDIYYEWNEQMNIEQPVKAKYLDSIEINNRLFKSVYSISNTKSTIFVCKNTGIIKFEKEDKILKLLNYELFN
jgi:hypothetical protein